MTRELRLSDVRDCILHADRLFVVADFDGTLCPVTTSPQSACVSARTMEVLSGLASSSKIVLAILSARPLQDVKKRCPVNAIFGGNHGMELSGPDLEFVHPEALGFASRLAPLCAALERSLQPWPGAWVDNKRWTATVHMRGVPIEHWSELIGRVRNEVFETENLFTLRAGHAALEIVPRLHWDKGSAVKYIQRRLDLEHALTFCLGDDTTDESMFRSVPNGITIRVGPHTGSDAAFSLPGPEAVTNFLEDVVALVNLPRESSAVWRAPRGGNCRPTHVTEGSAAASRSISVGSM